MSKIGNYYKSSIARNIIFFVFLEILGVMIHYQWPRLNIYKSPRLKVVSCSKTSQVAVKVTQPLHPKAANREDIVSYSMYMERKIKFYFFFFFQWAQY